MMIDDVPGSLMTKQCNSAIVPSGVSPFTSEIKGLDEKNLTWEECDLTSRQEGNRLQMGVRT